MIVFLGKALTARGLGGGLRVGPAEAFGVGDRFQFGIEASVEQHEEAESGGFNGGAMAGPGIRLVAGRIVEPVSGVGESLAQGFEVGVAGVVVAVEAEVGGLDFVLKSRRRQEATTTERSSPAIINDCERYTGDLNGTSELEPFRT